MRASTPSRLYTDAMIHATLFVIFFQVLNVLARSVEEGIGDVPNDVSHIISQMITLNHITMCLCLYIQELIDVFNNVLNETNEGGWTTLQTIGSGSQTLLQNAERYGAYLAATVNNTDEPLMLVRENISKFNVYNQVLIIVLVDAI